MVVSAITSCSSEPRAWGSRGGWVPPWISSETWGKRQVPEVTCHSQDVGWKKGRTHLVTRKALAV